jgi:cell division protein FtsL
MIRASTLLFWFGLSIMASIALYHTSDRTRELDRQLRDINTSIDSEQQTIHVLKAEWVYLANPARIEDIARRHLTALRPTATRQVIDFANLDDNLPDPGEARGSVATASPRTPVTPIKTASATTRPLPTVKPPVHKVALAAADTSHINNRMIMQHTASAQPTDQIGTLINELGSRP